jgi:hypothetical protein
MYQKVKKIIVDDETAKKARKKIALLTAFFAG